MDVIRFAIENPVKITVGVILLTLFGAVSLTVIPIQLTPDIERPVVTVRTSWQGRSPEEIEKSILIEQEEKLKTLQGLHEMTSQASLGRGDITLEFNVGYDMTRALQDVSNKLDEVPDYPVDVDRPRISASDSASDDAIAYCLIQSDDPDYDIADFYDYAERYVRPELERIPGVSETHIYGGREHQVQVRFDPDILAQKGVTVSQLRNALTGDNVNESAGDMENGRLDIRFRVLGRFDDLEKVAKTVLAYDGDAPIRIEDVADVRLVLEKNTHFDQCKGKPSMTLIFKREVGANILDIMKHVRSEIETLNGPGGLMRGYRNDRHKVRVRLVFDDTYYVYGALRVVGQNLAIGGALAVLVLLLFLRSTRPTLIIALTIPVCTVGTFLIMALTGRNLNVISLAGLSFAVGMVVDNAIVVLENIDRHVAMGQSAREAARKGAGEVWGAIVSSTLTTLAVFVPVLTIQEESGQLFSDIALAICAAVTLSLLVSVTVIPAAAARWLRGHENTSRFRVVRWAKSLFGFAPACQGAADGYARAMHATTDRTFAGVWLRFVMVALVTAVAVSICVYLTPPASYLPDGNKNLVFGRLTLPPGYSLRQNMTVGRRLEDSTRPFWSAKTTEEASRNGPVTDPKSGRTYDEIAPMKEFFFVISSSRVFMICLSADPENVKPLEAILNKAIAEIPAAEGAASQRSLFGRNMGGANSVQLEVFGPNMQRLREATAELESRLKREFTPMGVRSSPQNYDEAGPERRIVVDQIRAKELRLDVKALATAARAMVDGVYAGDFDFEGDNIDLVILRAPENAMTPEEIGDLPLAVTDTDGKTRMLPLGELVRFEPAEASQQIRRMEQRRAIQLSVTPPDEMPLETAQTRILEIVDEARQEGGLSSEIAVRLTGNADKLARTREAMIGRWTGPNSESLLSVGLSRFFLAIVITYLLMAALFESFIYPVVIMFSVPVAIAGGFVGLTLARCYDPTQQLDTLTMLGFIILVGIVVNNAILIVHQSLNFMRGDEEGVPPMSPREAVAEAVRTRIRPIAMTTATSVIGMAPLVLFPGAGSELYRGLGAVVVGGLLCSTLFTLLLVPLAFSLLLDLLQGLKRGRDAIDA